MTNLAEENKTIASVVSMITECVDNLARVTSQFAAELYDNSDYGLNTKKIRQIMRAMETLLYTREQLLGIETDTPY